MIDQISSSQQTNIQIFANDGERFIPTNSPRTIELVVSSIDYIIWKVPNLNQLIPISTEMWIYWVSLIDADIEQCRLRAIASMVVSKQHILSFTQAMKTFKGKYTCSDQGHIQLKIDMVTNKTHGYRHKNILWNWHRPFFHYDYNNSNEDGCCGEIIWFNHAFWFIVNHLENFFKTYMLQSQFMSFIVFLSSTARSVVLDMVSFLFTRQFMKDACLELTNNPTTIVLAEHGNDRGIRMIEALVKLPSFYENNPNVPMVAHHRWIIEEIIDPIDPLSP